MSDEALRIGEQEVKDLLALVDECKAYDVWPGYTSPDEWQLPAWKMRRNDDVMVEIGEDI